MMKVAVLMLSMATFRTVGQVSISSSTTWSMLSNPLHHSVCVCACVHVCVCVWREHREERYLKGPQLSEGEICIRAYPTGKEQSRAVARRMPM